MYSHKKHVLTALMLGASMLAFNSCGGGNEAETSEVKTDTVKNEPEIQEPKLYRGYEIIEKDFPATTYMIRKGYVKFDDMGKFFEESYGKIGEACKKGGHETLGAPVGFYFTWDDSLQVSDMAAGMAVKPKGTIALKDLEQFDIAARKCLMIPYYGAYEKIGEAHYAMDDYMKEHQMTQDIVMEEYITDPMTEPDTSKWLTNLYYFTK